MKHLALIELDVLFDTRIGTLSKFGDDVAIDALENGYRSRITDDISTFTKKITNEQFKEAYRNRDKDTLKLSRMTNFIFTLRNIVTELETNILDQAGILEDAAILLNVYPYQLTDNEAFTFKSCLEEYIGTSIPIRISNFSPDQLGLYELKEMSVMTYAMYNTEEWFNANFNIRKGKERIVPYPQLDIYMPMILPKLNSLDVLTSEDKALMKSQNAFDIFKLYWAPLFGVVFTPIELMTIVDTTIIKY